MTCRTSLLLLSALLVLAGCRKEADPVLPPDHGDGEEVWTENHHYRLPVVFHVLYADENDAWENVTQQHIVNIVNGCNQLYAGCGQDMNLELCLAETGPDGNVLEEPGINRVRWNRPVMDSNEFMTSDDPEILGLLWDPDEYVNVVLYEFASNAVLGVTLLPYTAAPAYLEGCTMLEEAVDYTSLDHPHCISLNNTYIMDYRQDYSVFSKSEYMASDPAVTLAHELGHYLGLRHVFAEDPETGSTDSSVDSDFCDDTPTYNKHQYDIFYTETGYSVANFDILAERTTPSGETFTQHNIMDYAVTYADRFTPEQCERVRYILSNGIFVPGPKKNQSGASAAVTKGDGSIEDKISVPVILVE